jgi:hypothetical protein
VRDDLMALKDTLDSGTDLQAIKDAYTQLETATFQIAEAMYSGSDTSGS